MEFQRISLLTAICLSSYLTFLCLTPPNPNVTPKVAVKDRWGVMTGPLYIRFRQVLIISSSISHAFVVLSYPSNPSALPSDTFTRLCPNSQNLNPALFTWSSRSIFYLTMIFIFASVRLLAFAQLGSRFTFKLAPPADLRTDGLYAWVQHPSYIGNLVVVGCTLLMYLQPDGVIGCWLSKGAVRSVWWSVVGWGLVPGVIWATSLRIRDEEKMLREKSGEKWMVWHEKTSRFVPGVF